mmetsp:Transcript_21540/g.64696  ORF Transcript_21540/g.64696 Transcript_21540/m.64696 type:complete len:142 (-) Transcript_21540:714-1139(-)
MLSLWVSFDWPNRTPLPTNLQPNTMPQNTRKARLHEPTVAKPRKTRGASTTVVVVVVEVCVVVLAVVVVVVVVSVETEIVVVVEVIVEVDMVVVVVLDFAIPGTTSLARTGRWNSPCAHAGAESRGIEVLMDDPKFAMMRS